MNFDIEMGLNVACCQKSDRPLQHLIGVWEINPEIIDKVGNYTEKLGVCESHYCLDKKKILHPSGIKEIKPTTSAIITCKRCMFCYKKVQIYSRGKVCNIHARKVVGKNIFTSCICQFNCPSFVNELPFLSEKIEDDINSSFRSRYICQICYQKNGG